jgi:carbon storage regulator
MLASIPAFTRINKMLVLSRKMDESIIINDNIEVFIIDIVGERVKIGIEAPKEIKILRSEIKDKINYKKDQKNDE